MIDTIIRGKARHLTVSLGRVLGGLYSHSKAVATFDIPVREGLEKGLLDIGILHAKNDSAKLRVWMDGISIVKEFRPNYSIDVKEGVFSSILIDVLPILKRETPKVRSKVIVANTGSAPFFVSHASLFTVREGGKEKKIIYSSGGVPLLGGEEREISLGDNSYKLATVNGLFVVQDPPHNLEVLINKKVAKTLDIVKKVEDVEMSFYGSDINSIAFRRTRDLLGKKKGHTIITSLSVIATQEEEREMELEAHVRRISKDELVAECYVKNLTDRTMKKVSLIGFASGMVLKREILGDFPENAEIKKKIEFKIPKDSKSIIIRLIWNDGGEVKFIEKRFKEKEN